jgi:hypothetical protein
MENMERSDNTGLKFNYDMLANAAILHAINDLGFDALNDEGVLDWVDTFGIDTNIIQQGIGTMPLNKYGMPDAKPAIRRVMETLDARAIVETELVDFEIQFGQTPLANLESEPNVAELENIELENIEISEEIEID